MSENNSAVNEETPKETEEVSQGTENDSLGDPGKKALEEERAARKEAEKRLKELTAKVEKFEDSQRTEEERREHELASFREQAEQERQARQELERRLLINEVAAEYGLPANLAERLRGADRAELEADAEVLKGLVVPDGPRKPAPIPEAGNTAPAKGSAADDFAAMFSNQF